MNLKKFIFWILSTIFFLFEFYLRILVGVFQTDLMYYLDLNFKQFSFLSSTIFCLTYGLMQLPVSILLNKLKLKKTILLGITLCSISCFGFYTIKNYKYALLWRLIMGMGSSFGFITLLITIKKCIKKKYIAFFIGFSQSSCTIISVIVANTIYSSLVCEEIGWRSIFLYSGFFGIILFFMIWLFTQDFKKIKQTNTKKVSIIKTFSYIQPWLISFLSSCIYFIIEYFAESNGKKFLNLKNIDKPIIGFILTSSWIGYSFGNPILGLFSDMFKTRKKIITFCSLIGLFSIIVIIYSSNIIFLIIGFSMLGFSASGQTIGYANIADNFEGDETAIGFAIENSMITIVSITVATITSFLIDFFKKYFSLLVSYKYSFHFFIIMYIIVFFISIFFLKDNIKYKYQHKIH